jgi:hypothetical protein
MPNSLATSPVRSRNIGGDSASRSASADADGPPNSDGLTTHAKAMNRRPTLACPALPVYRQSVIHLNMALTTSESLLWTSDLIASSSSMMGIRLPSTAS